MMGKKRKKKMRKKTIKRKKIRMRTRRRKKILVRVFEDS